MSGKTQLERDAATDKMDEDEMRHYIDELEAQSNNPLDHIELSINEKNQLTGKIKVHYDGHDSRNKFTAFREAMELIHKINRINKPPQTITRTKPMHLTDEKRDTE